MNQTAPTTLDPTNLPDDLALLKSLVKDLFLALKDKEESIDKLRHQLHEALRRHYGRKSETIDPGQMNLFIQQIEEELRNLPTVPVVPSLQEKKELNGHGRRKPSKTLPRQRTVYPLPQDKKTCPDCGTALRKIGEESSVMVDYIPATIVLKERVAEKWACAVCQGKVVTSELPAKPIERGMADAGMLAYVVTSKYADHLPLYRQAEIFGRQGFEVSRSTLCDWVGQTAGLLEPIYQAMKDDMLKSKVIHTDDTPVSVLEDKPPKENSQAPPGGSLAEKEAQADDPVGSRKARQGRLWVYVGDDAHPHTIFDYTPDRKGERPREFLSGWQGFLQADAYSGYDKMYKHNHVVEVACMAHARRKFFEAQDSDKDGAMTALAYIRRLYMVEKMAKLVDASARKELRQKHSKEVLDVFEKWLRAKALITLPKSPMGEAIGYALNQWEALVLYLTDGDLDIDNNAAENALRCVALGRKNWMFTGSDEGGLRAAVLFSLVASCKRHHVEPFAYLRDVISRVSTTSASRIKELLPAFWKQFGQPSVPSAA
jgi:transposase